MIFAVHPDGNIYTAREMLDAFEWDKEITRYLVIY